MYDVCFYGNKTPANQDIFTWGDLYWSLIPTPVSLKSIYLGESIIFFTKEGLHFYLTKNYMVVCMTSRDSIRSLQGPKARERCRHWADVCAKIGRPEITFPRRKEAEMPRGIGWMYLCMYVYAYKYIWVYTFVCLYIVYHRYLSDLAIMESFLWNSRLGTDS